MAAGTLDYALAVAEVPRLRAQRRTDSGSGVGPCVFPKTRPVRPALLRSESPRMTAIDIQGARQIGELAVHRESIGRALRENPDSLQIILDDLADALEREATGVTTEIDKDVNITYGMPREI